MYSLTLNYNSNFKWPNFGEAYISTSTIPFEYRILDYKLYNLNTELQTFPPHPNPPHAGFSSLNMPFRGEGDDTVHIFPPRVKTRGYRYMTPSGVRKTFSILVPQSCSEGVLYRAIFYSILISPFEHQYRTSTIDNRQSPNFITFIPSINN